MQQSLDRRLEKRPKLEELRERNVLPSEASVPRELPQGARPIPQVSRSTTMPILSAASGRDLLDGSAMDSELPSSPPLSSSPPPKILSRPLLPKVVQLNQAFKRDRLKRGMGDRRILDDLRDLKTLPVQSKSKPPSDSSKKTELPIRTKPGQERWYPFVYLDLAQQRPLSARGTLAESIKSSVGFWEAQARRWAPPPPPLPIRMPSLNPVS